MRYKTILYEVASHTATITLNRPSQLNSFTPQMLNDLLLAFDRVDADDAVRAVIVTGAGRAFCAGADLSAGSKTFDDGGVGASALGSDEPLDFADCRTRDGGGQLVLRIFNCLKPVIAAINGPAVGVGATMTLAMDIRMASEEARFGFVFARRGIVPEAASSYLLPRIVGINQALEWCFSGRVFPAGEARDGGLVKAVLPANDLLPAARALAGEIAGNSAPVSIALLRQMMWRGLGMSHPMEAHRIESRAILERGRSADAAEGVGAFLEKRDAVFTDRVSSDMPGFYPWWDEPSFA